MVRSSSHLPHVQTLPDIVRKKTFIVKTDDVSWSQSFNIFRAELEIRACGYFNSFQPALESSFKVVSWSVSAVL